MLGIALALSLLFHLVLTPFVRPPAEAIPYHVIPVITHIWIRPTPEPPKPPQRLRTPVSHPEIPIVSLPVVRPHDSPNHNGHVAVTPSYPTGEPNAPGKPGTNGIGGVISQPPVATDAPGPVCSEPDAEAKTLVAISPDQTASECAGETNATAMIEVDLDESGRVTGVSVYASTGSLELDRAALDAARESTYAPEMRDCQPVAGSYLFKVEFSS
jgi:TonB family protein